MRLPTQAFCRKLGILSFSQKETKQWGSQTEEYAFHVSVSSRSSYINVMQITGSGKGLGKAPSVLTFPEAGFYLVVTGRQNVPFYFLQLITNESAQPEAALTTDL